MNRARIIRVGKIHKTEDGDTVVDGWHVAEPLGAPPPREFTQDDWWEYLTAFRVLPSPSSEVTENTEIFTGWTLRELAELSVEIGEGATLPDGPGDG